MDFHYALLCAGDHGGVIAPNTMEFKSRSIDPDMNNRSLWGMVFSMQLRLVLHGSGRWQGLLLKSILVVIEDGGHTNTLFFSLPFTRSC